MDYFKTEDGKLVQYNPVTKVYRVKNNVKKGSNILTEEEFKKLKPYRLNKQKFCTQMNAFFKTVKHEWTYKNKNFRKLDNFELDEYGGCTNYDICKFPRHDPKESAGHSYSRGNYLVYHWGKVYLFNWSYNGYPQGQLFDVNTGEFYRWAKPKHCAPIFDETRKVIV